MKYLLFVALILLNAEGFSQNTNSSFKKLQGFSHPESVVFDQEMQVYYVSNMADKKEKDGFISKVSVKGEILDTLWVKDLDDPKGLLVLKDKLYVTDVSFLIEINRKNGQVLRRIPVKNSQSLNDIAADTKGNIFISDLVGNKIYRMDNTGDLSLWLHTSQLDRPNGLLISEGQLLVASWGSKEPGHLLKVNLETREIEQVTQSGIGNLDGLQEITPGRFYISDWATGSIFCVTLNGSAEKLITTEKSSGDILFLKASEELVIPMNHQNELWWYKID